MTRNELVLLVYPQIDALHEYDDRGLDMLDYMAVYQKYTNQVNHDPYAIITVASDEELESYYSDLAAAVDDLDTSSDDF